MLQLTNNGTRHQLFVGREDSICTNHSVALCVFMFVKTPRCAAYLRGFERTFCVNLIGCNSSLIVGFSLSLVNVVITGYSQYLPTYLYTSYAHLLLEIRIFLLIDFIPLYENLYLGLHGGEV